MANITPMMAQYLEIKAEHQDALLFYRMGDFYEMFFDDAVAAAAALDIALTKRGKHDGDDIPMCGVPVHAAEGYFLTLIRKGFRVAVCEQLESPAEAKKRGYKSVVKRGVVRLVTPGTLTEDTLLEPRRHNFLAAFAQVRENCAIAWVDISTGAFRVMSLPHVRLAPELARLAPSELLVPDHMVDDLRGLETDLGLAITELARSSFDSTNGEKRLCDLFGVAALDAFGTFGRADVAAMGAVIEYLDLTQKGKLPLLQRPVAEDTRNVMQIDAATRRNLELTRSLDGKRAGSLLSIIDRTVTSGGARLLERRLSSPSYDLDTLNERLDAVDFAHANTKHAQAVRDRLKQVPDLERALSRLGLDRGGPRDLAAIRDALSASAELHTLTVENDMPETLGRAFTALAGHEELAHLLDSALVAEPPILIRDGGFVASGYDAELDEVRELRDEGRGIIAGLQAEYAQTTGISSLKIKHNNVLGYFIETTATHAQKMLSPPLSETFVHRQTTANQVRFTTVKMSELESRIHNAASQVQEIEKRIYSALRDEIIAQSSVLSRLAAALAEIDLTMALADLARMEQWARPKLDTSRAFDIKGGRHPVVEQGLRTMTGAQFIANDCDLSDDNLWLLTGPNMAGKSTFLRQNALIALLAQMGSFVPARSAHIGLVSQLFSRVGASDDLARGRSTFMVEMVETAAILNQADDKAIVILDEIGRGTSTYDGLSIAWATLEHLHDVNKCRALFATHYHELTALAGKMDGVANATVAVKEHEGEIVFLHEVRAGAADRSYGVQVAQLAGLPPAVVNRARVVLEALEKGEREGKKQATLIDDLPLFSASPAPTPKAEASPVEDMVKSIHPDDLSPRDALRIIYELKDALRT